MTTSMRHDEAGIPDRVREYWDVDSATYDDDAGHHPRTPTEVSAWRGALQALLPPPPARVLDAGAGTGFLSLLLAELGHQVTALDLSVGMLGRLRDKAASRGLEVEVVEGDATRPPAGPFDTVVERHLLWTLPAPGAALAAWRAAAPDGRLVLVESEWGSAARGVDAARARARKALERWRGHRPSHHAEYAPELRERLPLGTGPSVSELLDLVAASGWRAPRLHRLRDVEWATRHTLPLPERLVGVQARYAIAAD